MEFFAGTTALRNWEPVQRIGGESEVREVDNNQHREQRDESIYVIHFYNAFYIQHVVHNIKT